MTIFLTGAPADTADDLDPKRLNRQIQECGWLINMVEGTGMMSYLNDDMKLVLL